MFFSYQSYLTKKSHYIQEIFDTNISHIFYYKLTFMNSQLKNTYSKDNFVIKNRFETIVLKISGIQK